MTNDIPFTPTTQEVSRILRLLFQERMKINTYFFIISQYHNKSLVNFIPVLRQREAELKLLIGYLTF